MSTEIVPSVTDFDNVADLSTTVAMAATEAPLNESEQIPVSATSEGQFDIGTSAFNTTEGQDVLESGPLFETFIVIEIVMTTLELIISILAAMKMPRWRRNYRNQMLMQLTLARFIKRIIFTFKFLNDHGKLTSTDVETNNNIISFLQIYMDFVIVILVFFFIKHMYNSLIIVLVKISHNNLYKVLICSWLIPVPVSAACTAVIVTGVVDKWYVIVFICSLFRWPLILLGTAVYVTILYKVLSDKIRKFARSLTVVTFLLCLTINIYLFSKDIMDLWCTESIYFTLLISYISGFLMNLLILILYVILVIFSYNNKTQSSRTLPDYSLADVNVKC